MTLHSPVRCSVTRWITGMGSTSCRWVYLLIYLPTQVQLTFTKITKIVATRRRILRLKCTKFDFGWGSAPDPAGGAYSAPPDPVAGFGGPTSKEREREGGEGKGGERRGGEGNGGKGRGGEGP